MAARRDVSRALRRQLGRVVWWWAGFASHALALALGALLAATLLSPSHLEAPGQVAGAGSAGGAAPRALHEVVRELRDVLGRTVREASADLEHCRERAVAASTSGVDGDGDGPPPGTIGAHAARRAVEFCGVDQHPRQPGVEVEADVLRTAVVATQAALLLWPRALRPLVLRCGVTAKRNPNPNPNPNPLRNTGGRLVAVSTGEE